MNGRKISNHELLSFLREYTESMSYDIEDMANEKLKLRIPLLPYKAIHGIVMDARSLFESESVLLDLDGSFITVGDLHGHILDLYKIIRKFDLPPRSKYIFLGDLVDRGEFSLETLTLVLILKLLFPNDVYVIRGNHEFKSTSQVGGFYDEVERTYPLTSLFDVFDEMFTYIPMAALVNKEILCIHGGLSPGFNNLQQIRDLQRPIHTYTDPVTAGLTWSDPKDSVEVFAASPRGSGFIFGAAALEAFLTENNLKMIIRGHECVFNGWETHFNNKIITVFSASYYCGAIPNMSAVLLIQDSRVKIFSFPATKYLKKSAALFSVMGEPGERRKEYSASSCLRSSKTVEPSPSIRYIGPHSFLKDHSGSNVRKLFRTRQLSPEKNLDLQKNQIYVLPALQSV